MLTLTLQDILFQLTIAAISIVREKQLAVDSFQPVLALSSHFPAVELGETLTEVQARNESCGTLIQSL